jgi:hypothetical protein
MSGLDVAMYMVMALVVAAIPIAVAMIPAFLLVLTERHAGRVWMYVAAVTLCVVLTYLYLNWLAGGAPDREAYVNFFAWAAVGFGSMTASIVAGIGRPGVLRQTMAAGSAALFVPVTLLLLVVLVFGDTHERLMAAGGVALAVWLVLRHWQRSRRPVLHV